MGKRFIMNRKIILALFVIATVLISAGCVYASDTNSLNTTEDHHNYLLMIMKIF